MAYNRAPGSPYFPAPAAPVAAPLSMLQSPSSGVYYPAPSSVIPPEQIFGGAFGGATLKASWYSHVGYTAGNGNWTDQSGNGNHCVNNAGPPAVSAGEINGYPGIVYTDNTRYNGRAGGAFTGLPAGTQVTVITLAKRNADTGVRGWWTGYNAAGAVIVRGGVTPASSCLQNADWQQGKQSDTNLGYVDSRTDRFHLVEWSGDLGVWYDGQRISSIGAGSAPYSGITSACTTIYVGQESITGRGFQSTAEFWLILAGTPTVAQRAMLRAYCDATYATDMASRSKWLCHAGQSNTPNIPALRPRNCMFWFEGHGGTALVPAPSHWGPSDPSGYRASILATYNENAPYKRASMSWVHGENEAAAHTSTAAELAGLEELYSYFAAAIPDFTMIVSLLPSWNLSGGGTAAVDAANVRAAQLQLEANHPTTVKTVETSDLTNVGDGVHFDGPSLQTLNTRLMTAREALLGDTDWLG